jgi:hypothetical protein
MVALTAILKGLYLLLPTAGPKQKQGNQYDQTYAAYWIETPLLAMPPNWKSSHKGYDEKYRKNKR